MPDISDELITFIKSQSTITALIGSGTACRCYDDTARQKATLPYVTFEIFGQSSEQHLTGIAGMVHDRIQIDAYAETRSEAYALAEAIRISLAGKRQTMGTSLVSEHGEGSYTRGNNRATRGSARLEHWLSRDYILTFAESTA